MLFHLVEDVLRGNARYPVEDIVVVVVFQDRLKHPKSLPTSLAM